MSLRAPATGSLSLVALGSRRLGTAGRALLGLLLLLTATSGCPSRSKPVRRLVDKVQGSVFWYRVEPKLSIDDEGALRLPPPIEGEEEDDSPYMERVARLHAEQFSPVWLDRELACRSLTGAVRPPPGPVFMLVHGIGGMGDEWLRVIPTLAKAQPAGLFMFRWSAFKTRGDILEALVRGVEGLARCYKDNRLVFIGHSAGGVLGAFAASRLELGQPPHLLELYTVASPLAGLGARSEIDDEDDASRFVLELGSVRHGYPEAAKGVTVVHLRTQYPADTVMKPSSTGYAPNAISAVVKGARVVDLPSNLGHDESLLYVAQQLVAGRLP